VLHTLTPAELAAVFEAERAGAPFLVFRDGFGDLRLVPLEGEIVSVGRAAGNHVVLEWDRQVSRTHAQLEFVGGAWVVVDGGLSRNGCIINAQPLRGRRRLADGDVLRLGTTLLTFRAPGTQDESTVVAGAAALARLTEAERRVLVALCRPVLTDQMAPPAPNREIADALHIAPASVKTHLHSLFRKLDVESLPQNQKRSALARRATESGLVSARDLDER
jgi:DNA-binding MarR family transcriptional regulator